MAVDIWRFSSFTNGVKARAPRGLFVRSFPRSLQFLIDLAVLVSAFAVAYLLRFDFHIPAEIVSNALRQLPFVILLEFGVLAHIGVYRFVWRYIGMAELGAFIRAAAISSIPIFALTVALPDSLAVWRAPRSVIVLNAVLAFGGVLAVRILRRAVHERFQRQLRGNVRVHESLAPVLLIGAGQAGLLAIRELHGRGDVGLDVRGFVDDDPAKRGAVIQGVKVLGSTSDLPRLVRELGIDHVVITIARASRRDIRRIVQICNGIPVKARIVPALHDLLQGQLEVSHIRDVQVDDLLGREPVSLDEAQLRRFLAGKTVMVTGAGGSIGSQLARQITKFNPSCVLLVERAEFALFDVERAITELAPNISVLPVIADVGDEARMRHVFSSYRPSVVFHAAAHKHVPMMESNASEAVKNNVLATRTLGELAGQLGVETFVLISTDKAVRPTSVMGASKRMAELVVQDLDRRSPTRFVAVRFGNVLDSKGSVIPIFREQIAKGGPVTVTAPDMKRYFMTIPEATQLVLQAGAMGAGGEIFILDMGKPMRILDLAKDMIKLSGLEPFEDIDIVYTGMRPGEKKVEELEISGENITNTRHSKIFIGKLAPYPSVRLKQGLRTLSQLCGNEQDDEVCDLLNELLPEAQLQMVREKATWVVQHSFVFPEGELGRLMPPA